MAVVVARSRSKPLKQAVAAEDFDVAAMFVGEAIGLINDVRPAADMVR